MKILGTYGSPWSLAALAVTALCVSGFGCGGHRGEPDRWIKKMSREIDSLKVSNQALQERLTALEETEVVAAPPSRATADRPQLRVVRLGPQAAADDAAAAPAPTIETGPRPIIRVNRYGSRIDHAPVTTTSAPAGPSGS